MTTTPMVVNFSMPIHKGAVSEDVDLGCFQNADAFDVRIELVDRFDLLGEAFRIEPIRDRRMFAVVGNGHVFIAH